MTALSPLDTAGEQRILPLPRLWQQLEAQPYAEMDDAALERYIAGIDRAAAELGIEVVDLHKMSIRDIHDRLQSVGMAVDSVDALIREARGGRNHRRVWSWPVRTAEGRKVLALNFSRQAAVEMKGAPRNVLLALTYTHEVLGHGYGKYSDFEGQPRFIGGREQQVAEWEADGLSGYVYLCATGDLKGLAHFALARLDYGSNVRSYAVADGLLDIIAAAQAQPPKPLDLATGDIKAALAEAADIIGLNRKPPDTHRTRQAYLAARDALTTRIALNFSDEQR